MTVALVLIFIVAAIWSLMYTKNLYKHVIAINEYLAEVNPSVWNPRNIHISVDGSARYLKINLNFSG